MNVIETRSLCKSYGHHQVLHDIDIQIAKGQLVGFLGPNGAGKTTAIRILMGLLTKSSGEVEIFDRPIETCGKKIRADIGYLPGDVHLYSNLTGIQCLRFFANARRKKCQFEAERLARVTGLDLNKNIRRYSTGMRQKLGLIQAMMHEPELLILDEPTSALDPLVRSDVINELRNVTRTGRTVLFSSHSLDEVESLCDEVIILRNGRIVEQQTIDELKKQAVRRIQVVFTDNIMDLELPAGIKVFSRERKVLTGTWSGNVKPLLLWIESQSVVDLIIERPDLNDLFISYYTDQNSD